MLATLCQLEDSNICGIFGMTSQYTTTQADDKFLKHCAIAGAVRGLDATGFVFLTNNKDSPTTYLKRAVNGATFVNEVWNPEWNMGGQTHSVIGHNRAATVGSINDDTAHPFIEGNIIGVHNGTLTGNWREDLQVSKTCDVDSRGLYRAISARGVDWAISNLHGAAALVWSEIAEQKVYVYRNADRPLYYCESKSSYKVYYASEAGMLTWLLGKCGIVHTEIKAFNTNTLYEITNGQVKVLRHIKRVVRDYTKGPSATPSGKQTASLNAAGQSTVNKNSSSATTKAPTNQGSQSSTSTGTGQTGTETQPSSNRPDTSGAITGSVTFQKGVAFRGQNVSKSEKAQGIVGEWAELGFKPYQCACCNKSITSPSFLESVDDNRIKLHHRCLDLFRSEYSADGKLISIVRDYKLKEIA